MNIDPEIRMLSTITLVEHISTCEWEAGKAVGWKDAAIFLRQQAGEAFKEGRDDDAHALREAAGALELEVPKVQENWRNLYKALQKAYWLELGERQNEENKRLIKEYPEKAVTVGKGE